MANRWGKMESVTDFIFLGSKINADGDCSREIKRCLLLGRKAMPKLDSILKIREITWPTNVRLLKAMINLDGILRSKDITLPTKVRLVKALVFPVVMYGCESWTIKKAEHRRIDAFELWC